MAGGIFWTSHPTRVWENCVSVDEFGAGHNDDCGPCANENLQACLQGIPPTYAHMDAIRTADIAAGWFTPGGGQTIGNIQSNILTWHLHGKTILDDYIAHHLYTTADINNRCLEVGNTYSPQGGIIVELQNAQALPFNEQNVFDHFVTILGYDSIRVPGIPYVLIANGDRVPLPKGTGKPDWYELSAFTAAQPIGILTVYLAPVTPPTPPIDVAGIKNDLLNATKALTVAQTAITDAYGKLP